MERGRITRADTKGREGGEGSDVAESGGDGGEEARGRNGMKWWRREKG